jgi:hypothetical protein
MVVSAFIPSFYCAPQMKPVRFVAMRRSITCFALILLLQTSVFSAAKPKVVSFGRWLSVKWMVGAIEDQEMELKVRPLLVNGEIKAYSSGEAHDITDKVFVVREAHRLNDMLPGDQKPRWSWQPGGWMMVNRATARITKITLMDYDAFYSNASWYRDLVAYCGVSDKEKVYAYVLQVGRRRPVLKKLLGQAKLGSMPNSECETPVWLRQPTRVSFEPVGGEKVSFNVRSQTIEVPPDSGDETEPIEN